MNRRQFAFSSLAAASASSAAGSELTKIKDVTIYSSDQHYCAFPSIVRRPNGELIVAFRRAPNRRLIGEMGYSHTDSNSYCVLVRSRDNGETWTKEPELIYAHPWGGSQDPCIVQLRDGSIVCASYLWMHVVGGERRRFAFQGGYVMRSDDGARTWKGPFTPPPVPDRGGVKDSLGRPLPAYNRGAICQRRDGRLYWAVAYPKANAADDHTDIHLMISADRGETWTYSCPIATDSKVSFNETSLYETAQGDLVAFVRTAAMNDHTVIARSRDRGKSFEAYQDAGWQGHPHHAARLADGRVFLVYGYRHKPHGIRARVLDAECTNFAAAPEAVLCDDGGGSDLGYPWAVVLPNRRILVTYYMQHNDGLRYIGGTLLSY
ncbi:MAG: exo-alpha-sialidase [Acidobacteria bacterium]|nr:exo-alpha-sialidase [Acidobacteriota bacterium]